MSRALITAVALWGSASAEGLYDVTVCHRFSEESECTQNSDVCYWNSYGTASFCADNVYDVVCKINEFHRCDSWPYYFINILDATQTFTSDEIDPKRRPAIAIRTVDCHDDNPSSDRMKLQQSIDVAGPIPWMFTSCAEHGKTLFVHQGLLNTSNINPDFDYYSKCMDAFPINTACGPADDLDRAGAGFEISSEDGGVSVWFSTPWGPTDQTLDPKWTASQNFDVYGYASRNYMGSFDVDCAQRKVLELAGASGAVFGSESFPAQPKLVMSMTQFLESNDCKCEWNGTACVMKTPEVDNEETSSPTRLFLEKRNGGR
jgi:hypothetical protein